MHEGDSLVRQVHEGGKQKIPIHTDCFRKTSCMYDTDPHRRMSQTRNDVGLPFSQIISK